MADIQLIQRKNQQKMSLSRRNSVPYKEIGVKESNGDIIIIIVNSLIQVGRRNSVQNRVRIQYMYNHRPRVF